MVGLGDGESGEGKNSLKIIIFVLHTPTQQERPAKDSTSLSDCSERLYCVNFSPLHTFLYPLFLVSRCSSEPQRFLINSREITDDFKRWTEVDA